MDYSRAWRETGHVVKDAILIKNVLHLASGNRWTGAAAPAFAEVEALRAAGVEAHYGYVGGYRLEAKIGHLPYAHAIIEKPQNPASFRRSLAAIEALVRQYEIGIVHAHLTWDHWLARFAVSRTGARLARTIHARRVLRRDPLTRSLLGRSDLLFVINDAFLTSPSLAGRKATFTPPPLDHVQFSPEGDSARSRYELPHDEKVVTVIGKLSKNRGFEQALQTFAQLRKRIACRMMIIGHGELRRSLEGLAKSLGLASDVIWAGYHEDDLAEHYRASDLLLFTARGSDEGHRAILEAMACGVPVATFPLEGANALVPPEWIAATSAPEALAATAASLLSADRQLLWGEAFRRSLPFGYAAAARRLIERYESAGR
jgi:glycosyltransferase involved in cell wall biosynthesis